MKKLIYEIPVHDDNDAEMIAREIEAVLGIRPARVEEIAPPCDKQERESVQLGGDSSHSATAPVRNDRAEKWGGDSSHSRGMTEGITKIEGDSSLRSE